MTPAVCFRPLADHTPVSSKRAAFDPLRTLPEIAIIPSMVNNGLAEMRLWAVRLTAFCAACISAAACMADAPNGLGQNSSVELIQLKMLRVPDAYFLLEQPEDLSLATLPPDAQDVALIRVRLVEPALYLAGRTIRGISPVPSDLFSVKLEILSVVQGTATTETYQQLTFAPREKADFGTPTAVPHTPKQLAKDYFAVIYSDSKGRHLAGFPMSEAAYWVWFQENLDFDQERRQERRRCGGQGCDQ